MKTTFNFFLTIILLSNCSQNKEKNIDELFKEYSGNVPGASLLIIENGKKSYEKTFGLANVEEEIPIKPSTNFRLASVTKQFTAMCILQLIENNQLTLKTNLKNIFPDFPDYGKKITIKHLLQHTSGLIDYEELIPDTATIQVLDKDVLNMMMKMDSTYFNPGDQYRYSNSAYAVLAMIIEKISGKSFADYLKQNIFIPVEMKNTVAFEKGVSEIKNRAFGYAYEGNQFVFKDQSITSAVLGDGGIYSSTLDLYLWDQIIYTDSLISFETLDQAFTSGRLNNGEKIDYGFGWHLKEFKKDKITYHTGSTCGFRNIIYRIPDKKFTVIILTNRDEPDLTNLAEKIVSIYLN